MSEMAQTDQFAFMTEQAQEDWYLKKALQVLRDAVDGVTEDSDHAMKTALDYLYYLDK